MDPKLKALLNQVEGKTKVSDDNSLTDNLNQIAQNYKMGIISHEEFVQESAKQLKPLTQKAREQRATAPIALMFLWPAIVGQISATCIVTPAHKAQLAAYREKLPPKQMVIPLLGAYQKKFRGLFEQTLQERVLRASVENMLQEKPEHGLEQSPVFLGAVYDAIEPFMSKTKEEFIESIVRKPDMSAEEQIEKAMEAYDNLDLGAVYDVIEFLLTDEAMEGISKSFNSAVVGLKHDEVLELIDSSLSFFIEVVEQAEQTGRLDQVILSEPSKKLPKALSTVFQNFVNAFEEHVPEEGRKKIKKVFKP